MSCGGSGAGNDAAVLVENLNLRVYMTQTLTKADCVRSMRCRIALMNMSEMLELI